MANVLSQEEVDSLLSGIEDGKVTTETAVSDNTAGVPAYDFSKKSGPAHLRMPALGIIHERFINLVNGSILKALSSNIDVSVTDIDSVKFGDFCRSLPLPTSLNIYKMEPLKGFGLLVLEGALVFAFVDVFFGGKCISHVKLEGRSFTAIERKVIDRIVGIVLEDLEKAWADVHKLNMIYTRSEIDPQFAGIAKPNDMVIVTRFQVDFGNYGGIMKICLPYDTIEPIRQKLSDSYQAEKVEVDQRWRKHIEGRVKEMSLSLKCMIRAARITGRELLGMQINDVLLTEQKVDDPVLVEVGHLTKFKGFLGVQNNKKAVRIEEIMKTR